MKKQRISGYNKKNQSQPLSPQVRQWIQAAQNHLKNNQYQEALEISRNLEQTLKSVPEQSSLCLTAVLWQIRALQAMKQTAELDSRIQDYIQFASDCHDNAHQIQGYRLLTQRQMDASRWQDAIESLAQALDIAIRAQDGKNAFELLMHMSAIEIKSALYCDAMEHLARGLSILDDAGISHEEAREIKAIGQRQLCELFDKTGEGEAACNALEAAMSTPCHDIEEHWLQQILLSQFDRRFGNAIDALDKLQNIKSEITQHDAMRYHNQLEMVELEIAHTLHILGNYEESENVLSRIQADATPIQRAISLIRYQWAVESGLPHANPDTAKAQFDQMPPSDDPADRPVCYAAEIALAAQEIMYGHLEQAFDLLQQVSEKAIFTELIPISTRSQLLMAEIEFIQKKYEACACRARDVTEAFIQHVDDVSAKQSAALMLRAQYEVSLQASGGDTVNLDKVENASYQQLLSDCSRYLQHGHIEAFLDLGLELANLSFRTGDIEQSKALITQLEPHIDPTFMAWRACRFYQLKYKLYHSKKDIDQRNQIIQSNHFVLE